MHTPATHTPTARSLTGLQPVSATHDAAMPGASRHTPSPVAWDDHRGEAQRIAQMLTLVAEHVPVQRRVVHAGDIVYRAGDGFGNLFLVNAGCFKIVNTAADGRAQVVGLQFKGDWLGFDGIADQRYRCDAVALDTGEIWSLRYDALLAACAAHAPLMALLHAEMSRVISRDRDALLSLTTLSADARVAEFLRLTADAMARRGLRTDQITLRMTRAEIGNYLGMTLESVSRALSRLARQHLIGFADGARREISIPDVAALGAFVGNERPACTTVQ
jgi:CRP/FNR family transcriptional regulator